MQATRGCLVLAVQQRCDRYILFAAVNGLHPPLFWNVRWPPEHGSLSYSSSPVPVPSLFYLQPNFLCLNLSILISGTLLFNQHALVTSSLFLSAPFPPSRRIHWPLASWRGAAFSPTSMLQNLEAEPAFSLHSYVSCSAQPLSVLQVILT